MNGLFAMSGSEGGLAVALTLLATWACCIWAGSLFHRWIEVPSATWRLPLPAALPGLLQRLRQGAARAFSGQR
jgi:hypothetical protein